MTIQTQASAISYVGNAVTTSFAYNFRILVNTDVQVYINNVLKTLTTDYSVTGVDSDNGGNIVFVTAPASGAIIYISRSGMQYTQLVDYVENDPFPAETHEKALDKLTLLIQQAKLLVDKAIHFPSSETLSTQLAAVSDRAGQFLKFDTAGNLDYDSVIVGEPGENFIQQGSGAVSRVFQDKVREMFSVKDFGATGDGATDDTTAITAAVASAIATGRTLYFPAGTYICGAKLSITGDISLIGAGRFVTTIKLKNGTNDTLIECLVDANLGLFNIGLDGNNVNNTGTSNGIICTIGAPHIENCYIRNFRSHCVVTGNLEYGTSDLDAYCHDLVIVNNIIQQPLNNTNGGVDCLRMFKIARGLIAGNYCIGGLSQIRSSYWCSHISFLNNICDGSYGDVGVTASLSTDVTVANNICVNQFAHGIEIDGVIRGTINNNVCTTNGNIGLTCGEYGPPTSAYNGYLDGVLISTGTVVGCSDLVISSNVLSENDKVGASLVGNKKTIFVGNTMSNNNQDNDIDNAFGLYINGGTLNNDGVYVNGNRFDNIGYQTMSMSFGNLQYQTFLGHNYHSNGISKYNLAQIGAANRINTDVTLLDPNLITLGTTAIVEDTVSKTGYARQITDASGAGDVTMRVSLFNIAAFGEKLIVIRYRNVNTMTSITVNINIYAATVFAFTVFSNAYTGLDTSYQTITLRLADSLKSYNYDQVDVEFVSTVPLTGSINVSEISLYRNFDL